MNYYCAGWEYGWYERPAWHRISWKYQTYRVRWLLWYAYFYAELQVAGTC